MKTKGNGTEDGRGQEVGGLKRYMEGSVGYYLKFT